MLIVGRYSVLQDCANACNWGRGLHLDAAAQGWHSSRQLACLLRSGWSISACLQSSSSPMTKPEASRVILTIAPLHVGLF